jgi:hypothetical protein
MSLSDAVGAPIAFATDDHNGVIHVSGSAVPEPSSLVMALGSLGVWLAISSRLRRNAREKRMRSGVHGQQACVGPARMLRG